MLSKKTLGGTASLVLLLISASCLAQQATLVSAVSNFGTYGDPNSYMPSCQWPYGTAQDFNYLWEGRFWVGAVVDGIRHVSHADYGDYEWHAMGHPLYDAQVVLGDADFCDSSYYNDLYPAPTHFPMHLSVNQIVTAFASGQGPSEAFLVQQTLHNTDDDQVLDSVYIGWVFDFDVASGDLYNLHIDDWASYQPERSMGYMWDGDNPTEPGDDTGDYGLSPGYAGIALIDAPQPLCSFQWWNWDEDPANDDEKFQFLAGIHPASGGNPFRSPPDSVFDYRVLISTGPYSLSPGDSIYTAMTFAVGDSMDGLDAAVDEMIEFYYSVVPVEATDQLPAQHRILTPHPNPFNSTTILSFELRVPSNVSLRIYDTAGRLVTTLVHGWREAGGHEVTFDGLALTSGIYIFRLEAREFTALGKMVLMK
jgi:hypothetical protein